MKVTTRAALVAIALSAVPCQAQTNLLRNSGFENGGLAGWGAFGNVFHETTSPPAIVPRNGTGLTKMFGGFTGQENVGGIFQSFPANPGEQFLLDCFARHWSGDPLTGSAPTGNSMVMKVAFFDNLQQEIAGFETTILDGTSPTDVWIDASAVGGLAPAGTVEVQALILFLQPGVDGGAGQVDDIVFFGFPDNPPYPGTGEDILLTTGVGPGGTNGGMTNYVKTAVAGDYIECNVTSPGGAWIGEPYFIIAQPFATGFPPVPSPAIPSLYIDLAQPIFILVGAPPPPIGAAVIPPAPGASSFFLVPSGLTGNSLMLQALITDAATNNGVYAASDGYEIQFL